MPERKVTAREAAAELDLPLIIICSLIQRGELAGGEDGCITGAELDAFAARRAAAGADIAEAFAQKESVFSAAFNAAVVRASGVDPERARELGF